MWSHVRRKVHDFTDFFETESWCNKSCSLALVTAILNFASKTADCVMKLHKILLQDSGFIIKYRTVKKEKQFEDISTLYKMLTPFQEIGDGSSLTEGIKQMFRDRNN